VLIGRNPFEVGALIEEMDKVILGNPSSKAAVDMALYGQTDWEEPV
jgi:L-alanine-DL-glutamate epimerase-like enolase superfamily enzyme